MKDLFLKIVLFAVFITLIGVIIEQKRQLTESESWRYRWKNPRMMENKEKDVVFEFSCDTLLYINKEFEVDKYGKSYLSDTDTFTYILSIPK